jgi:hypothetical protein
MDMPLASAPKRTRALLACLLTVPWALISIVWLGLLPRGWRFEQWPPVLQGTSIMGCVLFWIADALFAAWYFLTLVADAYRGKSDG